MSDTRESFEKLALENEDDITLLVNDKTGEKTYADLQTEIEWLWFADGAKSQQAKIDELTEIIEIDQRQVIDNMTKAITALEARCKELTKALLDLSFECFDVFGTKKPTIDTYNRTLIIAQPTTPQEALDRFENEVIEKFRKDMARTSRMTYKAKKEVK